VKLTSENKNTATEDALTSRIALCLSYNGRAYHGWQYQKDGLPTLQKSVEEALSKVANHPVEVVCAGRTDRAVHASYQVVHFDTPSIRSCRAWIFGSNANLPKDISVTWAGEVDSNFHARFSALSRRYQYIIYNHPIRPSNFSDEMTWCHDQLDADVMHESVQCLVGEHDFTSFRAVGCQSKSPVRSIEFLTVKRYSNIIVIDIKGNAFLHHMVRNIAGVLMAIGRHKQPISWCQDVLNYKDRTKAGVTASPYGLYLTHIAYPDEFGIPESIGAPSILHAMLAMDEKPAMSELDLWGSSHFEKLDKKI